MQTLEATTTRREHRHAAALRLLCEQRSTESHGARTGDEMGLPQARTKVQQPVGSRPLTLDRKAENVRNVTSRCVQDDANHRRSAEGLHIPSAGSRATLDGDYLREFLYGSDGRPKGSSPVVDCRVWDSSGTFEKRQIIDAAVSELRSSGYVVLEGLLDPNWLLSVGEEFRQYKSNKPIGVTFARMRARRDMTIPPFEGPWTEDWLVRHPLVLAVVARHLRNSLDTSNEKAAELQFAQWIASGAPIEHFLEGPCSEGFPVLDLMVVVDTPPGAPAQSRHRDTILPGPCASLGVHIPLTPLQLKPLNGSIGFTPCSHRVLGEEGNKTEVVGACPLGSVILYDSFTEHHGLENASEHPRAALFSWYRVPGVYSGHTDENFGKLGLELTMRFRKHVQQRLNKIVEEERRHHPASAGTLATSCWGFRQDSPLVEWGEERVCFRCNCTTGSGSYHQGIWFCTGCWEHSRGAGQAGPDPAFSNVMEPFPDDGRFSEQQLFEFESQGMNIRPSRGRHKLTLLRERGVFLPMDPSDEWLGCISTEPQPEGWKNALRKAIGEIPRMDGF